MAELLLVRYAPFYINTQIAVVFSDIQPYPLISIKSKLIIFATSLNTSLIDAGIYTDPPNDFSTLAWFIANGMKIDKPSQSKLLRYLQNYTIDTVTVI